MNSSIQQPFDDGYIPAVNRPETILGVTITFLVSTDVGVLVECHSLTTAQGFACIAISLRLYVRLKDRLWGYDDLFVFLAGVSLLNLSILLTTTDHYAAGNNSWLQLDMSK